MRSRGLIDRTIGTLPSAQICPLATDAHTPPTHPDITNPDEGPVIEHVKVFDIFVNTMPSDFTDFMDFASSFLVNGGLDVLEGYGVLDGQYLGFGSMSLASGQPLTEEIIDRVIGDLMSQGYIYDPLPGEHVTEKVPLVVFHLPPKAIFTDNSGVSSAGRFSGIRGWTNSQRFYAVICDTTLPENHAGFTPRMSRSIIWSHLVSEWAVNPLGNGWWEHTTGEGIADLVAWDGVRFGDHKLDWWISKIYCVDTGSSFSKYRKQREVQAENPIMPDAATTIETNESEPIDPDTAQQQLAEQVNEYLPDFTGRDEAMAICKALEEYVAGAAKQSIIPLEDAVPGLIWIGWLTRNLFTDMTANAHLKVVIGSFQDSIIKTRKLPSFPSEISTQGAQ
jgi:hypothetical protein